MLYQFVKPLARWILGQNFKRIYLSGLKNIPDDGPVILAANHPTAFIEPCVLASFQNRPIHFLVRGDFFRKKIFSYLLQVLHMIPIYRMKDGGYKSIKNNFTSFERCYDALAKGKALMILSEGFCIHEKRLRPIRKGTARLAFGTLSKHPDLDLIIVPVGVNYTDSDAYRSDLMIDFGEPIKLSDYKQLMNEDEPEAIRELTKDLQSKLRERVLHIQDKNDDEFVENYLSIFRSKIVKPAEDKLNFTNERLKSEIEIVERINKLDEKKKESLRSKVNKFLERLKKVNVSLESLSVNAGNIWMRILVCILVLPFAIFGWILLFFPFLITSLLGSSKGISIEFRHSVKIGVGLGVILLQTLVLFLLSWKFKCLFFATFAILTPILIFFALRFLDYFKLIRYKMQRNSLDDSTFNSILKERSEILEN